MPARVPASAQNGAVCGDAISAQRSHLRQSGLTDIAHHVRPNRLTGPYGNEAEVVGWWRYIFCRICLEYVWQDLT
jgi:hypothetical protein